MTIWEFACAQDGYVAANSNSEKAPPELSDDRMADMGIEGF